MSIVKNDMDQSDLRYWGGLFAILGGMAVILGAFGAHGLEGKISNESLDSYHTAVLYQFVHVIAALITISQARQWNKKHIRLTLIMQFLGILLFSGSIYLLSTQDVTQTNFSFLGPVTPIGGVFFILSWILMASVFLKKKRTH